MSSNRTQSESSVLVTPSTRALCPAVNPLLLCRNVSVLCCTSESNMSLLGANDLNRCDAIPNIRNIFISHPDAWTGAVWSEFDECISWSLAFLLVRKRTAGRHRRVGVCRDSVGLTRSCDSKRKYRFEIRQGGFNSRPIIWPFSHAVMKFRDGYYLHTWHHYNQYQRHSCCCCCCCCRLASKSHSHL